MRIPRFGITSAILATGLFATALMPSSTTFLSPAADSVPGFEHVSARAHWLGLPDPRAQKLVGRSDCAMAIDDPQLSACFPDPQMARDYISGYRRGIDQGPKVKVVLAGSGGVSMQWTSCWGSSCDGTGDARVPGWTCYYYDCSSGIKYWFYSYNVDIHCTHAYPQNDLFANSAPTYRYYGFNRDYNFNPYHPIGLCWRVVMYPGSTQQGAGAVNCIFQMSYTPYVLGCGDDSHTYNSISWHNA